MISKETIDQIEKRWVSSSIIKTNSHHCHLEHWSCAIQILIDELRSRMSKEEAK